MMDWIVSSIICSEFDKRFERHRRPLAAVQAMDIHFSLSTDYNTEEGYRKLIIRIFATSNYVTVLMKECWNVKPHGASDYHQGDTGWILASHHDSCWRDDGVRKIMMIYRHEINTMSGPLIDDWYFTRDLTPEEVEEGHELIRMRDTRDFSRHINSPENQERLPLVRDDRAEGA